MAMKRSNGLGYIYTPPSYVQTPESYLKTAVPRNYTDQVEIALRSEPEFQGYYLGDDPKKATSRSLDDLLKAIPLDWILVAFLLGAIARKHMYIMGEGLMSSLGMESDVIPPQSYTFEVVAGVVIFVIILRRYLSGAMV